MWENIKIQVQRVHEIPEDNSDLYHQMPLKYENEGFYTGLKDTFVHGDGNWNTHAAQDTNHANVNEYHKALQDKFIGPGSSLCHVCTLSAGRTWPCPQASS